MKKVYMSNESTKTQNAGSSESTKPTTMKPVSERKARANRENSKKSTGPKTARGKRYSSFNALKHGLQAKKVMFSPAGTLVDEGLQRLFESLHAFCGPGDVTTELLVELAVTDYWRLQKALEFEVKYLSPGGDEFHPQGGMPTLVRYMNANRRAFEKTLQMLKQAQAAGETDGKAADDDADSDGAESAESYDGGSPSSPAGNCPKKCVDTSTLEESTEDCAGQASHPDGIAPPATAVDSDLSDGKGKIAA
jgi:hypothetical protein